MKKYLVTIEFRYYTNPINEDHVRDYKNKTITIGVYDTMGESIAEGNKAIEVLESRFKLHTFHNGSNAIRDRFSKNGGCFGSGKSLITNLAYLKTPFDFYAKIDTLHYECLEQTISNVLNDIKIKP